MQQAAIKTLIPGAFLDRSHPAIIRFAHERAGAAADQAVGVDHARRDACL